MIEFQDVSIAFGDNQVLDRISFRVAFHEKIAFLGGSGEGKTTILKLILALELPDEGKILIDGKDVSAMSENQLREMRMKFSIVFQEGALFDSMSVKENVAFCLREYSDLSEGEIERDVRAILRKMNVENAIDLMPEELSGGMQRRVAIARSLAAYQPQMILYDEPTTGLDPITADQICALINELSSGEPPHRKGCIAVTHKVTDAAKIAERFLYLRDGRITFDGTLESLLKTEDVNLREFINELLLFEDCK